MNHTEQCGVRFAKLSRFMALSPVILSHDLLPNYAHRTVSNLRPASLKSYPSNGVITSSVFRHHSLGDATCRLVAQFQGETEQILSLPRTLETYPWVAHGLHMVCKRVARGFHMGGIWVALHAHQVFHLHVSGLEINKYKLGFCSTGLVRWVQLPARRRDTPCTSPQSLSAHTQRISCGSEN